MQSTDKLDNIDKNPSCVFASKGDVDNTFISGFVSGINDNFATPISNGGSLITRQMINAIGMLATTELFMAKIGCLETYINGVSYPAYAKLEFVDNYSISHTVFATRPGLGNFNTDSSLVSNSAWKNAGSIIVNLVTSFN